MKKGGGGAALPFALDPTTPAFLFPPILQTVVYAVIWIMARLQKVPSRALNALPFLRASGSVVSFLRLSFSHRELTFTFAGTLFYLLSGLIPIGLIIVYWVVYLRTARGVLHLVEEEESESEEPATQEKPE